jgi:hypothetical protein
LLESIGCDENAECEIKMADGEWKSLNGIMTFGATSLKLTRIGSERDLKWDWVRVKLR